MSAVKIPVTNRMSHFRRRRTAAYSRRSTTSSAGEEEACIFRCTLVLRGVSEDAILRWPLAHSNGPKGASAGLRP